MSSVSGYITSVSLVSTVLEFHNCVTWLAPFIVPLCCSQHSKLGDGTRIIEMLRTTLHIFTSICQYHQPTTTTTYVTVCPLQHWPVPMFSAVDNCEGRRVAQRRRHVMYVHVHVPVRTVRTGMWEGFKRSKAPDHLSLQKKYDTIVSHSSSQQKQPWDNNCGRQAKIDIYYSNTFRNYDSSVALPQLVPAQQLQW